MTERLVSTRTLQGVRAGQTGLVLVKSVAIGTAVSTVTVTNAFSSQYTNYKIIGSNIDASAPDTMLALTFGSSAADYYSISSLFVFSSGSITTLSRNAAASAYLLATAGSDDFSFQFDVFCPNKTVNTTWAGSGFAYIYNAIYGGLHNNTAQTDFTLGAVSGVTLTGGTIKVYGYKD